MVKKAKQRKSRNCDKEYTADQKLKEENKRLKKENKALRKQIGRLDLDSERFNNLRELADKQYREELARRKEESVKKKWTCHECGKGILRLIIIPRRDGNFYFRACDACSKKTGMKKYHSEVEGEV